MKHAVKHIHFVGVGGAGMSGIAEILHNLGYVVSGSDQSDGAVTRRLAELGIRIHVGHDAAHITGAQAVVTSTAVKGDNPEVIAARAQRIPVVPRAVMLAELMRLKQGIAIAGTHGKTTTTSLVTSVLAEAGVDPTFVIGGKLNAAGANSALGSGDYIVVEADESDASFLNLLPILAVVTNIDRRPHGHLRPRLRAAEAGLCRVPAQDAVLRRGRAVRRRPRRALDHADDFPPGDHLRTGRGRAGARGGRPGTARRPDALHLPAPQRRVALPDLHITLNLPGEHNVRNALAAIAIATELELPDAPIVTALAKFSGVGRRFQRWGDHPASNGGTFALIDDYGHHPVEMAATIAAARGAFPGQRLVLAFQPHRFTRTRDCFEDFVKVLGTADAVLLTEVYSAGESPIVAADGRALVRALRVAGKVDPLFVDDIADLPQTIVEQAQAGDVVIAMGAGTIGGVPARVVELIGTGGRA